MPEDQDQQPKHRASVSVPQDLYQRIQDFKAKAARGLRVSDNEIYCHLLKRGLDQHDETGT